MSAPTEVPIACTLTPADLRSRLDRIQRLTTDHLVSHTLGGGTLQLAYRINAWPEVEAIIAAERECCAFLRFDLQRTADTAELVISAPPGVDLEARWLFDQFLPQFAKAPAGAACGCPTDGCG